MRAFLLVGLGGFIGSILRYGIGRVPISESYPVATFLINLVGAFIVGFVSEITKEKATPESTAYLFTQTGLCGGFTTFSTFSLETIELFRNERYLVASSYAVLSVACCLAGVCLGILLAKLICARAG
jgi:CrcB protein